MVNNSTYTTKMSNHLKISDGQLFYLYNQNEQPSLISDGQLFYLYNQNEQPSLSVMVNYSTYTTKMSNHL
jgi:hypothetical protein